MKTAHFAPVIFAMTTALCFANSAPPAADRTAILGMAGEFKVHFQFEETFGLVAGYEKTKPYAEEVLEKVVVVEDGPGRIVLQHLLIPDDGLPVIKHWTQVWTWQDRRLTSYIGQARWKTEELPAAAVRGQWTQRVGQVDDSPRYEGMGRWIHENGISIWESTTWRPLPRREHTTRQDYDVIEGTNRHILTADGWVHEQDNTKLITREGQPRALARERGCNLYTRVRNEDFARATAWWEKRGAKWNEVRTIWEARLEQPGIIKVNHEGGEGALAKATTELVRASETPEAVKSGMAEVLEKFTSTESATADRR